MAGVFCQRAELRPSIGTVRRTPTHRRLCWRKRLRGDSHPPAGRPRGSPLLWTGLESRFPRGIVGATLVVARLDRSMLSCHRICASTSSPISRRIRYVRLSPRPFWVPPAHLLLQLLLLPGSLRDERLQGRTDGGFDQVGSLLPDHDRRGIGIPVHNGGHN